MKKINPNIFLIVAFLTTAPGFLFSQLPTVTTTVISEITSTSATSGGNVIDEGGSPVSRRGICWSTSPNPTVGINDTTWNGGGPGIFASLFFPLMPNTSYFVRAYAINTEGTAYGTEYSFTTLPTQRQLDSLVLVELFNSTNGPGWINNDNWLTGNMDSWHGITVSGNRVTHIDLTNNNLSGSIPASIGNLTELLQINFWTNDLQGPIPEEIGNLTNLTKLVLNENQLTGSIPVEISYLINLSTLYLGLNQLSGSIPPEVGNLANLNALSLMWNQLSGSIPPEIGNLTNLIELFLNKNQLTGSIPPEIGNLANLEFLILKDNLLTGTIPEQIWDLSNLRDLHVGINNLTGPIPSEIGNLTTLIELKLYSNHFSGTIPNSIGNLSSLIRLDINSNDFSGPVPPEITGLLSLSTIKIQNNQFTSLPDLSPLTSLDSLYIQNNQFTFYDIEPNMGVPNEYFEYSPQSPIPVEKDGTFGLGSASLIYVLAGGNNCQYQWFKDYNPQGGLTNDTIFMSPVALSDAGEYYCWITNPLVPGLTLNSDTVNIEVIDAIIVSNTNDSGNGSLRNAIEYANANPGRDSIAFDIPGWWTHTIEPDSPLPDITDPVVIDGYTQPGATKATATDTAILKIALDGINLMGLVVPGLRIVAGNSTIRGLMINRYGAVGIHIQGAGSNIIEGNFIGVDSTGWFQISNQEGALNIVDSRDNIIGGDLPEHQNIMVGGMYLIQIASVNSENNLIKGNMLGVGRHGIISPTTQGINIRLTGEAHHNTIGPGNVIAGHNYAGIQMGPTTRNTTIIGNYIGINGFGNAKIEGGPTPVGVFIEGAVDNIIGPGNVISGQEKGIYLALSEFGRPQDNASRNTIIGNRIGTNSDGNGAIPNEVGIGIDNVSGNTLGGLTPEELNIVSGNDTAISIKGTDASSNLVIGNYIGTNINGTLAIPNNYGIWIGKGANSNTIGGTTASEKNIISGNTGLTFSHGVVITDPATAGNFVKGNFIGLDASGKKPLGNAGNGIHIVNSAHDNYIGGTDPAERNVISGNGINGIELNDTASANEILGNFIGLDASGTKNIGHPGGSGIYLGRYAHHNIVGGTEPGAANSISGNTGWAGIDLQDVGTENNTIIGNILGTDITGTEEFGNRFGVSIMNGASNNRVGGLEDGEGNLIVYSLEDGMIVYDEYPNDPYETSGNLILSNLIHSNGSLGIDLGDDGVTPNDEGDIDGSPNNLQNYPVLDLISFSPGEVSVNGSLESTPGTEFTLQFFASLLSDHSTYGEGETYLGSEVVSTNAQGDISFSVTYPIAAASGQVITATATDPLGNTSEFSQALGGAQDQILSPLFRPFHYRINENGVSNILDDSDLDAVKSAFQTWSDVSSADIEFEYDGTTSEKYASANDGVNLVTFEDEKFLFGPNILAVAAKTIEMGPGDEILHIQDVDIVFNPLYVNHIENPLAVVEEGENTNAFDIQSVTVHELGHVLGLIHSGAGYSSMWPIIYSGSTEPRSLEKDDIAWVSHKYPSALYDNTFGFISGRITYGDIGDINNPETHPPVAGALVLAVHTETLEQIHAYSDADGNYLVPIPLDGPGPESFWIHIQPLDGDVFGESIWPGNISEYIYANTIYTDYPDEYYNGNNEGPLDDPDQGTVIEVSAGITVEDINLITNKDIIRPEVISLTPKNDSVGFRVIDPIIIVFSEAVDLNSISDDNLYLTYEPDGNTIYVYGNSIALDESSDRIVFQPDEPLRFSTTYTIHIETDVGDIPGISDLKGNVLLDGFISVFTTEEGDSDPPEVTDVIPADGAVNVFVTDQILVQFSEPMDRENTTDGFTLSTDGIPDVEGSFEWNPENTLLTFSPLWSMLEGAEYYITLSTGITDLSGNALDIELVNSFTTVPEANPEIIYVGPENGRSGITVETPVVVDFTEPVNTATVNSSTVKLRRSDGSQVAGNFKFLLGNSRIVFRPDVNLNFHETYTIEITGGNNGIHDASTPNLPLVNTSITTFQTAPVPVMPQITSLIPYGGVLGTVVTINGSGFDPDPVNNTVLFNGTVATVSRAYLNSLVTKVPLGAQSGPVTVSVNGSMPSDPQYFYVQPQSLEPCDDVIANVSTGPRSRSVAISPNSAFAYVTNSGGGTVSVIDLNAQTPSVTTTISVGDTPLEIDINPEGTLAYVTNFGSHTVSVIDLSINQVIETIHVGINPYGIAVAPDGKRVYVANYTSQNISMIDVDPSSGGYNQVVANINTGTSNRSVAITPNAALLLVTGDNGLNIYNSDPEDVQFHSLVANVSSGVRTRGVAISPNAGLAIVVTLDGNLKLIDIYPNSISFGSVVANIHTGSRARSVVISPDAIFAYVTLTDPDEVAVYKMGIAGGGGANASYSDITLTLHNTIPVGQDPEGLVIDPAAEKLVVVNSTSADDHGTVTVVSICCGPVPPQKSIGDLIITIQNMVSAGTLDRGQGNALTNKLYHALKNIAEGKNKTAVNTLNAFIDQITDLMDDRVIPEDQGTGIIDATQAIINQLDVKKKSEVVIMMEEDLDKPDESGLGQIYPNPFKSSTTINYSVNTETDLPIHVRMGVYSITGQLVANLVDQKMSPGNYTFEWHATTEDGRRVPKGTYIIRFVTDNVHNVKILVKLD